MMASSRIFEEPALHHTRKDFLLLRQQRTVHETIEHLRQAELGNRIFYFYAIDPQDRLTGIIPARELLTSAGDQVLADIMLRRVVEPGSVPQIAVRPCSFQAATAATINNVRALSRRQWPPHPNPCSSRWIQESSQSP